MPILMVGLMVLPAIIMSGSFSKAKRIAVIDYSEEVGSELRNSKSVEFVPTNMSLEEARAAEDDYFGVLVLGEDIVENPRNASIYSHSAVSITLQESIADRVEEVIEKLRVERYDIENLSQIMSSVEASVVIDSIREDMEEDASQSSVVASALGYVLGFMLYVFLLMYGTMVMTSVIEEKGSRVLEVLVSCVKPFDLMMGKILGVASVAVTQIAIWGVLILLGSIFIVPLVMPADMQSGIEMMQNGGAMSAMSAQGIDSSMIRDIAPLFDVGYLSQIVIYLLLFFVGGYLLYSSLFAAAGSAVESVQDAQQLQTPMMVPIMIALFVMIAAMDDPNSPLVFWCSMIPLTSPIVMIARIPYGIPTWEIITSLVILYSTFIGAVWLAAKIYRVGIFMYGKKPSLKEVLRWVRYRD